MARTFSVDVSDLHQGTELAWEALRTANVSTDAAQFIFRYGDVLSRFERNVDGMLVVQGLDHKRMRYRLSEIAEFGSQGKDGWIRKDGAPDRLVGNVLATPNPQLPIVQRVVEVPVLTPDGHVHATPGYSDVAQVFYEPTPGLVVPKVRTRPSRREVTAARRLIVNQLLGDFPFVSDAEVAHAVAMLLQPFVRDMISGPTPLYLVEAPTPGTGKGLLVQACCWPAAGAPIPPLTEGRDEDEWRKRITAKLRESPMALLIDNLRLRLDSAAVASALTLPLWSDRILGVSHIQTMPNRCIWVATGNNPALSSEMVRRSVRIRLDAEVERPEDRGEFRHPDLLRWAAANRGRLIHAALTLASAWVAAGQPPGEQTLGSYESWAAVMGGLLEVVGVTGFLGNLDDLRSGARDDGEEFGAFLLGWYEAYGDRPMTVAQLEPALLASFVLDPSKDAARQIGHVLGANVDRHYNGVRLQRGAKRSGVQMWRVLKVVG